MGSAISQEGVIRSKKKNNIKKNNILQLPKSYLSREALQRAQAAPSQDAQNVVNLGLAGTQISTGVSTPCLELDTPASSHDCGIARKKSTIY